MSATNPTINWDAELPRAGAPIPEPDATVPSAVPYLAGLFNEEDYIFFFMVHSTRKHLDSKSGEMVADVKLIPLMAVRQACKSKTIQRLKTYEADGWNIYVCMNPFPAKTKARQEQLVKVVRNVFIESDQDKGGANTLLLIHQDVTAGLIPAPHSVLSSSPGNYHIVWHVDGISPAEAKVLIRALASRFYGDMASTDLHRVLRLPEFKNLKYETQPESILIEHHPEIVRYTREQFKIKTAIPKSDGASVTSKELEKKVGYLEANAAEAQFSLGERETDGGGYKWVVTCPWASVHTHGGNSALIMLLEDGRFEFNCFHGHCNGSDGPQRGWSDIRSLWKETVGHFQRFGDPLNELVSAAAAPVLYNLQTVKPTEDVWIVEGELNTLVIAQTGATCVGYPSAHYRPTEADIEALMAAPRLFLAGDNDPAGKKAMDALQKRLRSNGVFRIQWPNGRKDANEVLTDDCGNDPDKFKVLVEELKARATQTEPIAIIRNAEDIKPLRVTWLWHERIPFGMMTLFAGNPGNGKSMASTSVAAICSKGNPFPATLFAGEPRDVLMLIGEDDIARTVIPRLKAARADMKRIKILEGVRPVQGDDRAVRLDTDLRVIENALAANPNIRLLIIDPISNYLGKVSMVAEQEVRSILTPLMQIAERFSVAVILVMHLNKKADLDAIMRVGGAMAFVGVARCSWLFARNVKEETSEGEQITITTDEHRDEFSMLRMKNNLAPAFNTGLSYSITVRDVSIEGVDVAIPYVKWGTAFDGTADNALTPAKPKSKIQHAGGRPIEALPAAKRWLEDALQDNQPHPSKVLIKDAAEAEGITDRTLRRAYEDLGGIKPFKVDGHYCWQLAPLNETTAAKEIPQQSELLQVEGML